MKDIKYTTKHLTNYDIITNKDSHKKRESTFERFHPEKKVAR